MARFVAASYSQETKIAQFLTEDGRVCIRSGGSIPWRVNNAGDLLAPLNSEGRPAPKKTKGYLTTAPGGQYKDHYFFIFPDYESGRRALKACLGRIYMDKNFAQFVHTYASGKDHNNEQEYVDNLVALTGFNPNCTLRELGDAGLEKFMDAIETVEGYHKDEKTRKETWATVSTVHATDGRVSVSGAEIVVCVDGKDTIFVSNESGQFPPIVHGKETTEIFHVTPEGNKKKVADLPSDQGQHHSLLVKFTEFFGWNATAKAPKTTSAKRHPFVHKVKSGETLEEIAAHFQTSADELKQINNLPSSKLIMGQVLGIYGPPPKPLPPDKPKKAVSKPKPKAKPASETGDASASGNAQKEAKPAPPAESVAKAARSKEGTGEPIALVEPEDGFTPWTKHALQEAKTYHGLPEWEIQKSINYHTQINDGETTMIGTPTNYHAWCAAFANWCLMKAHYPVKNSKEDGFIQLNAQLGRANGFIYTASSKSDKPVLNPLFTKIDDPVDGAIVIVTKPGGYGHHVGFVWGRSGPNKICILGGNQTDRIIFAPFIEKAVMEEHYVKDEKSGKPKLVKKLSDHLEFCLPTAYMPFYEKNEKKLSDVNFMELNKAIGYFTDPKEKKAGQSKIT